MCMPPGSLFVFAHIDETGKIAYLALAVLSRLSYPSRHVSVVFIRVPGPLTPFGVNPQEGV